MKLKKLRYPLVKLPAETQLVLHLIREDLKINHFFNGLGKLGIDDSYYEPHLSTAIFACLGFEEIEDDLVEHYLNLVRKHSENIEADNDSIMKQALRMYMELMELKRKRSH